MFINAISAWAKRFNAIIYISLIEISNNIGHYANRYIWI